MSLFGKIDEFIPTSEKFADYVERLNFYLEANSVEDEAKKRSVFLTVIGSSQFRLLKDLVVPAKLTDKTYSELCAILKAHHEPAPPKFLQRASFEARNRKPGESCQQYIAELRNLAEYCQFGAQLEERLCERFARGINDEQIQRKLLCKTDLTLHEAVSIAVATMTTTEAARSLQSGSVMFSQGASGNFDRTNTHDQRKKESKQNSRPGQHASKSFRGQADRRCGRCGGPHSSSSCKFASAKCFKCSKTGHIAKVCRSAPKSASANHFVQVNEESQLSLFALKPSKEAYNVDLLINNRRITFQIDTGASLSVISATDYRKDITTSLQPSDKSLSTYTGEKVKVVGETSVEVKHRDQCLLLPLLVIEGEGPPLIGRDWLRELKLDWNRVFSLTDSSDSLKKILKNNEEVFGTDPGLLKDCEVSLHIQKDAIPKFCKARHPPYALRSAIEEELERLQRADIIENVQFADWATPIVPVLKKDKSVRICGDYKTTVNRVIHQDQYPIPLIDELAHKLAGGVKFSKLDFSNAYTQLSLDAESRKLTTINTHKGLFRYKRLCFGFSSCPSIFQRVMEGIFLQIPNCVIYFDDLYITGSDDTSHLETLNKVLQVCKDKGLRIRREKCEFLEDEVNFLGYRLNKNGLQPQPEKLRAIKDAPKPSNINELRAYLGLVNYYAKFIHNASSLLAPLYDLLHKGVKWHWGREQQRAFDTSKSSLSSDKLLVHFDPTKQLILTCDASPRGVGAILSHRDQQGERPIAYASRSLNAAEQNYAQIDREALSLIFGVTKFRKYILGHHIDLFTDHKPLLGLFGEHKAFPENASARVQRWALILSGYSYRLAYRPGHQNNADALSRLPLPETQPVSELPDAVDHLFNFVDELPVTATDIASETMKDPVLKQVYNFAARGWPSKPPDDIRAFTARRNEISIDNGCLLWGTRVIIPASLRSRVLDILHETHIGISRMKAQARSWVWWPLLDYDIERLAKTCVTCEQYQKSPPKSPLHPWDWPQQPWSRVHMDFAGPFLGKMFLIIIDAHSKWIDVKIMNKITANDTILELRDVFSTLGLPEVIVTDNGPTWTSELFQKFLAHNGVKHITSAPYSPSTNGLAERAVQIFKQAMIHNKSGLMKERVLAFLTKYRSTPHTTTGVSPSELILGRKMRTHLDLLHPSLQSSVFKEQARQKDHYDRSSREREVSVGENVFVRNYGEKDRKWISGVITKKTGPVSYQVDTDRHGVIRRHQNQIRTTSCDVITDPISTYQDSNEQGNSQLGEERENHTVNDCADASVPNSVLNKETQNVISISEVQPASVNVCPNINECENVEQIHSKPVEFELRRSGRLRKPPERLGIQ